MDPPASQTGKRGGRKRPAPAAEVPEPKKFASAPQPAPPVSEEQIVLDTYYYATLEGDAAIVKEEFKNSLTLKVRRLRKNLSVAKVLTEEDPYLPECKTTLVPRKNVFIQI